MYSRYLDEIQNLYKDNMKKLRTGTTLYGQLFEGRWQTHIILGGN